jgi:50S ribosomal protein L16 3-hydroxylase
MPSISSLLGALTPAQFIETIWQQQPLLIRNALPEAIGIIDGDDLAGIACESDSDARIISCDAQQTTWQCEQGPFDEQRFATLPTTHWTLLVQSVDQWIPDVQNLLKHFQFLPRWRLDDIMVSYATDGGGVGPHFDYYDVFLLQASGKRRWQIGQACDENTPLQNNEKIKLLRDFHTREDHILQAGDMLYLPAGVAHWGTAIGDECITISIGFRAASQQEIVQTALDTVAESLSAHLRYRDTTTAIDADTFCINTHAVDNLMAAWQQLNPEVIRTALAQALGELATEPRNLEHIAADKQWTLKSLQKRLQEKNGFAVEHHPASRFAYRKVDNHSAELYVDGGLLNTTLALAKAICHGRITADICHTPDEQALVLALLHRGSLGAN